MESLRVSEYCETSWMRITMYVHVRDKSTRNRIEVEEVHFDNIYIIYEYILKHIIKLMHVQNCNA